PQSVAIAVLVEGGLALLAIALGWLLGVNPLHLVAADGRAALWGCLAALPMLAALLLCERLRFWPFSDVSQVVDRLVRPLFAGMTVAELAIISALAGIGEELLFRGLVQEGLSRWIDTPLGPWIALLVASALFGLLHPMSGAYILLAAVMGLLLGGLWLASDNLLTPIVAHAVYDFAGLVWLVKWERPPAGGEGHESASPLG
ncbi:MAG: CPBP family intramembrane glutamic endopeptidase, partial [Thermoguttaceae bacterium]